MLYDVYTAKDLHDAVWCKGVIDQLFATYPTPMLCWYALNEAGEHVVSLLGNEHERSLARSIVGLRALSEEFQRELA